jgi:two-component system, sensor histidine kinase PdtaS
VANGSFSRSHGDFVWKELKAFGANSIKHAFDHEEGRISVSLKAGIGYGQARLTVSDNGKGMREVSAHNTPPRKGSGLRLIDSLARQIGGDVKRETSAHGTSIIVEFPVLS